MFYNYHRLLRLKGLMLMLATQTNQLRSHQLWCIQLRPHLLLLSLAWEPRCWRIEKLGKLLLLSLLSEWKC